MESIHYLLMKSHSLLQKKIAAQAYELGLSSGQPKVLDYLYRYGESDQKTIASYCEIEQTTAGSILLRMESADLVRRRQRNGNRRSLYVSLTGKGKLAAEKLQEIFDQCEAEACATLSLEKTAGFKDTLGAICQALQENRVEVEQKG